MPIHELIYCSRNAIPDTDGAAAELESMVSISRDRNRRDGITGALILSNQCFAQVLEGSKEAVDRTFERIRADPRHREVTLLQASLFIAERHFATWTMAYSASGRQTRDAGAILEHALKIPDEVTATEVRKLIRACVAGAPLDRS